MERLVDKQLVSYLSLHQLLPPNQSGFRTGHSTESAITKVLSDLLDAVDHGESAVLALLDLSASRSLFVTLHSAGSGRTYAVGFSLFVVAVQLPVLPTLSAVYLKGRSLGRFCSLCIPLIYRTSLPPTVCLATCMPTIASLSQIYGSCRSDSTAALSAAVSDCSTAIAD